MDGPLLVPSRDLLPPEWKRLAGDGPVRCFNPGLLRDGRGFVLASRVVLPDGLRRIALCRLDAGLHVVPGSQVPFSDLVRFRGEASPWFADPRLYRLRGKTWVCWNTGWQEPSNRQLLCAVDPATLRPAGEARELVLDGPRQPIEKNWMLFGERDVHAVYSAVPHRVLDADLDGGGNVRLVPRAALDWETNDFAAAHGALRGGAPPVRTGDVYTSIGHAVAGPPGAYRYVAAAYRFSAAPPFAPTDGPRRPLPLPNPLGTSREHPALNPVVAEVVYPCGAVVSGTRFTVSYGVNDERVAIATLDEADLLASLAAWPGGGPAAPARRTGAFAAWLSRVTAAARARR